MDSILVFESSSLLNLAIRLKLFLSSNSEARRALVENSISINKNKVDQNYIVSEKDLIKNKYVIINRGKKKTFILKAKV